MPTARAMARDWSSSGGWSWRSTATVQLQGAVAVYVGLCMTVVLCAALISVLVYGGSCMCATFQAQVPAGLERNYGRHHQRSPAAQCARGMRRVSHGGNIFGSRTPRRGRRHSHAQPAAVCACARACVRACVHTCVLACVLGCVLYRCFDHLKQLVTLHDAELAAQLRNNSSGPEARLVSCVCMPCASVCMHLCTCLCKFWSLCATAVE